MRRRNFTALLGAAAAAWPRASRAQQHKKSPLIGFLSPQSPGAPTATRLAGFHKGLAEVNFFEGRNVSIEYRWAEGHYNRLPALANDLLRRQVAVIAALTQDAALAAKAATATVPIVFNVGGDPVKAGLIASMSRPGGNATGVSMFSYELETKRLGLLHELVPKATSLALLINPNNASSDAQQSAVRSAALSLGLQIQVHRASTEQDLAASFDRLVEAGAQALLAAADPFFANQRDRLVTLAAKYRLPAIWEWPDFVEGGGLMSYGTNIVDNYRQAGVYTGRVLRGEKPSELPVIQPVSFVLALNLRTVKALGLEVPQALLARADEVFE